MAYTLGNKCAKNLCKRIVLLQLIIKNVVTCFLEHSVVGIYDRREHRGKIVLRLHTWAIFLHLSIISPSTALVKTAFSYVHYLEIGCGKAQKSTISQSHRKCPSLCVTRVFTRLTSTNSALSFCRHRDIVSLLANCKQWFIQCKLKVKDGHTSEGS